MSKVVVDASALLAVLENESYADRWAAEIQNAAMSAVNFSEVVAKLADVGMPMPEIRQTLEPLGVQVVPFDTRQAYDAGALRPQTKPLDLSFGDRACLALARSAGLPVLTRDRVWTKLQIGIEIRLIH
ncbi:MAG: PIN domain-containing protein [bacterium]